MGFALIADSAGLVKWLVHVHSTAAGRAAIRWHCSVRTYCQTDMSKAGSATAYECKWHLLW